MLIVNVGVLSDWQTAFADCLPGLRVCGWDDPGVDPGAVRYALVWAPTPGRLARFPNLELILSSASGVDHILKDPAWPAHVPIVRMVTPETGERMADYVTLAALALIRDLPQLIAGQRAACWQGHLTGRLASETRVGILGLGQLGIRVADRLAGVGFKVAGWSRSPKPGAAVESFAGPDALPALLARSDILVNLLPRTMQTRGILDAGALAALPQGAGLINVGRSDHLDAAALTAALDSGHLGGAVLDVFDAEPLPAGHPLWAHPKVLVTPHIASTPSQQARARQAAQNILAHREGRALAHLYDAVRGY
ncbi:MAG: glyoxylate/hydroxypyruvate reductase [Variovorax sp.]|nr:glyoxylate/hydroxypyruvate reductase [Variovorax sp.]